MTHHATGPRADQDPRRLHGRAPRDLRVAETGRVHRGPGHPDRRRSGHLPAQAVATLRRIHAAASVDAKTRALRDLETELADTAARFFRDQRDEFLPRLADLQGTFPTVEALREAPSESDIDRIWRAVEDATEGPLEDAIDAAAPQAMALGGEAMARDIGLSATFQIANPNAVAYLEQLGARRVAGINRTTRRQLATILARAADEGRSYQRVAAEIRERFDGFAARRPQAHIGSRAELVATTELAQAYESGAAQVAGELAANGIDTRKAWLTAGGDRVCPTCEPNGAQGYIPRNDVFESGDFTAPAHPACRCAVAYRPVEGVSVPSTVPAGMSTLAPV